jgi:hypothetical protein
MALHVPGTNFHDAISGVRMRGERTPRIADPRDLPSHVSKTELARATGVRQGELQGADHPHVTPACALAPPCQTVATMLSEVMGA